jgi:phytanoyl-CoA hydroxylase
MLLRMDTRSIAEAFERDGYVIVRSLLPREEVATIERELERFIREVAPSLPASDIYFEDSPARPIKSMFRLNERSEIFAALLRDARLLAIMDSIYTQRRGGAVVPESVMYFGKPARDGSVTPQHQDNAFQCWDPPLALTATLAIDESTPENGALTVLRGSHELGLMRHRQSGVLGFSRCLIDAVDEKKFPPVRLCMKPGDVALHHINTVHFSGANTTDRSRRQIGIGYRGANAKPDEAARAEYRAKLNELLATKK